MFYSSFGKHMQIQPASFLSRFHILCKYYMTSKHQAPSPGEMDLILHS